MKNYIENPQAFAYVKAAESYSILVNELGKKTLKSRPMKHYEANFLNLGWLRVHRSYLVNPVFVKQIADGRNYLFLTDGTKLPIARRQLKNVTAWRMKNI